MKYTHDDTFVNLDDELDESDRFEGPVEKDKKEVRKKVWRRTGNGQWEGERGLDVRYNEEFTGAGLYLSKRRPGKRLSSFEEADLLRRVNSLLHTFLRIANSHGFIAGPR